MAKAISGWTVALIKTMAMTVRTTKKRATFRRRSVAAGFVLEYVGML
jgi:hypothetical protein